MRIHRYLSRMLLASIAIFSFFWLFFNRSLSGDSPEDQALDILEQSGVRGGVIVHFPCGDGTLTEALRASESYIVQGLDPSIDNVREARQSIRSKHKYGPISIDQLTQNVLPYEPNLVNLIVAEDLGDISMDELMRVLTPNGIAMIKGILGWDKTVKPVPPEQDEWNHYLYNACGNAVSRDETIGPIKHYQWIGSPRWARHHDTTASMSAMVSANGRIFYILDEGPKESIQLPAEIFLVARDAYNGTVLWKRSIPEWQEHLFALKSGPAYLPRRLVAVGDRVYVTLGINAPLSELDAATGGILRTFPLTELTSELVHSEGTLFLVVGRPEKNKEPYVPQHTYVWDAATYARSEWAWSTDPAQIMALDISEGGALWTKQYPVAPLSLSADSNSVYFFNGDKIISLDRYTGEENWSSESLNKRPINTAYAPRVVVYEDVVLFSSGLRSMVALSALDGTRLWQGEQPYSGHYSPEDIFVIDGLVYAGATANMSDDGTYVGRDVHTGEVVVEIPCDADIYWFHQRCYPSKATSKYILPSRTGIEFVDLEESHWTTHHFTRGGCLYGVMPGNGLVYTPPHACACYPEAKLNGFGALGGAREQEPDLEAAAAENRLDIGPAYGLDIIDDAGFEDWPTYRHDARRSAYTASSVASQVLPQWEIKLGGKLSSPVAAGNRVYAAQVDAHTVYAVHAITGHVLWYYTAGGRVDSPPTIYKGRVLFGSADGYVYCLRAADGALVWRFRAAPMDQRMVAYEQLESVWPVHGSVLVQGDKVYCVAGRSAFMDGGLRLLQLDPVSGEKLSEKVLDEIDPESGENLHAFVNGLNMPVGLPDILSSDGQYVYMRSQQFDLDMNRTKIEVGNFDVWNQTGAGAHVFSPVGFLDDSQFSRSYMMYGKNVKGGWGGWEMMGWLTPSGRLIAVDGLNVYAYGRKPEFLSESIVLEYQLYAAAKSSTYNAIMTVYYAYADRLGDGFDPSFMNYVGDWKLRQGIPAEEQSALTFRWRVEKPSMQVRGMVLANGTLFIAGPPDIVDEEAAFFALDDADVLDLLAEQSALRAVSAANGETLAECQLDSLPVWDGMIAAGGRLYMTTMDGDIACFSGAGRNLRQRSTQGRIPLQK
jgi:outer membrane protein assembly factor BamB